MSMMMVASAAMVNLRRIWRTTTAPDPAVPAFVAHFVDDIIRTVHFMLAFLGWQLSNAQVLSVESNNNETML